MSITPQTKIVARSVLFPLNDFVASYKLKPGISRGKHCTNSKLIIIDLSIKLLIVYICFFIFGIYCVNL